MVILLGLGIGMSCSPSLKFVGTLREMLSCSRHSRTSEGFSVLSGSEVSLNGDLWGGGRGELIWGRFIHPL